MALYLTKGVNRCRSSTAWFDLLILVTRRDRIQIVKIGVLEIYQLLSPTALLSCKVALDEGEDRVTQQIPWFKEIHFDLSAVKDKLAT